MYVKATQKTLNNRKMREKHFVLMSVIACRICYETKKLIIIRK